MCVMLLRIVSQFNIWSKIGYFMMENATNNDTMLSLFGAYMDTLEFPFDASDTLSTSRSKAFCLANRTSRFTMKNIRMALMKSLNARGDAVHSTERTTFACIPAIF